jgi:hypothetical protein
MLAGAFSTLVVAYMFTEYLLTRFDARRRILVGDSSPLLPIIWANGVSFIVMCSTGFAVLYVAGVGMRGYAMIVPVCFGAQGIWFTHHLWFYYRDHLRLGW